MRFMIIERFRDGKVKEIYRRFAEKGRLLPDGVLYIDSWINEAVTICYQVMEAPGPELIRSWTRNWEDLADFEIIPVIGSAEARQKVMTEP